MSRRGIELYEADVEMCPSRGIDPNNFIAIKDARRKDARGTRTSQKTIASLDTRKSLSLQISIHRECDVWTFHFSRRYSLFFDNLKSIDSIKKKIGGLSFETVK